jgi:hypothetical protein
MDNRSEQPERIPPFNPHSNCAGHVMSFLEAPLDSWEARDELIAILDVYYPEAKQ